MPQNVDPRAIEHAARELLDARITAVRELATAQSTVDQARDALATAEANHANVYANATRAGWSDAELKQMGLASPTRRPPGRPRKARGAGAAASAPSSDQSPTGASASAPDDG